MSIRVSAIAEAVERALRAAGLFDRFREPPAFLEALHVAAEGLRGARRLTWDPRGARAALVPVSARHAALVCARDLAIEDLYEIPDLAHIWVGQLTDRTLEVYSHDIPEPIELDGLRIVGAPAASAAPTATAASSAGRWVWPATGRILEAPAVLVFEAKAGSVDLQLCGMGRAPLVPVRLASPSAVSGPCTVALSLARSSDGVHGTAIKPLSESSPSAIVVRSDGQLQDILRGLAQCECS